jgi:hypothetical protein
MPHLLLILVNVPVPITDRLFAAVMALNANVRFAMAVLCI